MQVWANHPPCACRLKLPSCDTGGVHEAGAAAGVHERPIYRRAIQADPADRQVLSLRSSSKERVKNQPRDQAGSQPGLRCAPLRPSPSHDRPGSALSRTPPSPGALPLLFRCRWSCCGLPAAPVHTDTRQRVFESVKNRCEHTFRCPAAPSSDLRCSFSDQGKTRSQSAKRSK